MTSATRGSLPLPSRLLATDQSPRSSPDGVRFQRVPGSIGESGPLSDVSSERIVLMSADAVVDLLKAHFRQLRLPTMGREFERLARDAAAANQNFLQFLLGLTETELATRAANAIAN